MPYSAKRTGPAWRALTRWGAVLSLLWGLGLVAASEGQAQGLSRFAEWTYTDARAYVKTVVPGMPVYMLGTITLLLPGTAIDAPLLSDLQGHDPARWPGLFDLVNEVGGPRVVYPVVGLFTASLLTAKPRFQDAAFTALQSWAMAGTVAYAAKFAFGRYRPGESADARRFSPFSGHSSFPSGHTTAAFALLTPWVLYYPHPVTYGLFAVSTGTAVARVLRNKHWPTDVVAGAVVGVLMGRWLTGRHQQGDDLGRGRAVVVVPVVVPAQVGLALRVRWPSGKGAGA